MKNNKQSHIRFYEELNDFLPPGKRKQTYELPLLVRQTVKDLIEAQGVPHTEVDLILANGEPVEFSYIVKDGDRSHFCGTCPRFSIQIWLKKMYFCHYDGANRLK